MPDTKKILILDDEPEILELLDHLLGKQYIVHTKNNILDFEKDLHEFRPNLLLIDHFLGDNTSNELIRESLRKLNIPFILHSAHEEIEKLYRESNAAGYIKKPSSIAEIRKRVAQVLEDVS
ncbi:MAG TPA: response regulator [Chitinophagaceae bacterium]